MSEENTSSETFGFAEYDDTASSEDSLRVAPDEPVKEGQEDTPTPKKESPPKKKKEEPVSGSGDEMSHIEEAARAQGWVDFDEWDGDPSEWRPADIFIERGKYFETMSKQNQQIKRLNKQLEEMSRQVTKIREQEYNNALEELKKKRIEAAEDGRYEEIGELDEKIDAVKEEAAQEQKNFQEMSEKEKQKMLEDFVAENPWYAKEPEMKKYADMLAAGYVQTEGADDLNEVLDYVVNEVKTRYSDSDYFKSNTSISDDYEDNNDDNPSPKRNPPKSKVDSSSAFSGSGSSNRKGKKVATAQHLNATQKQIGQRWVDTGAIESLDKYAEQLQEIGEVVL